MDHPEALMDNLGAQRDYPEDQENLNFGLTSVEDPTGLHQGIGALLMRDPWGYPQ
jgi:hypothetical protein